MAHLSGAQSHDLSPLCEIVSYEWDLDGDGQYDDAEGVSADLQEDAVGLYDVGLRVTSSCDGATDEARTVIEVKNCRFIRGDVNSDNRLNIADAVFILSYLFRHGVPPSCMKTADVNDDSTVCHECGGATSAMDCCGIDISDPLYIITYTLRFGPQPAFPFPECGRDQTEDALTCDEYPPCR